MANTACVDMNHPISKIFGLFGAYSVISFHLFLMIFTALALILLILFFAKNTINEITGTTDNFRLSGLEKGLMVLLMLYMIIYLSTVNIKIN